MSLSDFDRLLAESSIRQGFCTREQIQAGIDAQVKQALEGRKYYLGQVLIKQRALSANQYLQIENSLERKVYECESCRTRYNAKEIDKDGGLTCRGCSQRVAIEIGLDSLTEVEVLASRDPAELAVPLRVAGSTSKRERTSDRHRDGMLGAANQMAKAATKGAKGSKQRLTRSEREAQKDQVAAEARGQLADLSRYEIIEELGRGGMGTVFKARHKDMDRLVALKVVKSGPHISEKQLVRFVREGRAAARLSHPGIIRVFDIGTHRDFFYLAMEFVDGRSLHQVMRSDGVSRRRAFQVMDQLLDAVAFAHEHEVIHRDLKPQNVVVDEMGDGGVRLIDFGLAKGGDPGGGSLTQTGQVIGTVFYLSPEQTRGESRDADGRSDIFALGVIFYEMLTGVRPFEGRSAAEVYSKILKSNPVPPSVHQSGIDREADAICLKALQKDAAKRYQTAGEFRDALRDYRDRHDVPDSIPEPVRAESTAAVTGRVSPAAGMTSAGTAPSGRPSPRVASGRTGRAAGSGRHAMSSGRHGLVGAGAGGRSRVGGAGGSPDRTAGLAVAGVVVVGALLVAIASRSQEVAREIPEQARAEPTSEHQADQPEPQQIPDGEPMGSGLSNRNGETAQAALDELRALTVDSPEDYEDIRYRFEELIERFEGTASTVPEEARREIQALEQKFSQMFRETCEVISKLTEDGLYRDATDEIAAAKDDFTSQEALERLDALEEGVFEAGSRQLAAALKAVSEAKEARNTEAADALLKDLASCGLPMVEGRAREEQKALAAARVRWRREARQEASVLQKEFQKQFQVVASLMLERKYRSAGVELQKISGEMEQAEGPQRTAAQRYRVAQLGVAVKGLERFFDRTVTNLVTHYKDAPFQALNVSGRVREADESGRVELQIGTGMMVIELTSKKEVGGEQLMVAYQQEPSPKPQDASLERICFSVLEGLPVLEDDVETLNALVKAVSGGLGMSGDALISGLRKLFGDRLPKPAEPTLAGGEAAEDDGGARTRPGTGGNRGRSSSGERRAGSGRSKVSDKELGRLIGIESGGFTMGSDHGDDDEEPRRAVILSGYAIGKYEVTNSQYKSFLGKLKGRKHSRQYCHPQEPRDKVDHVPAHWSDSLWNGDHYPVVGVDWWDAFACARAFGCRLPTEAEWERSARVHEDQALQFPWGNPWEFMRVNSMARWLEKASVSAGDQDEFDRFVRGRLEAGEGMTMPVTDLPEGRSPIGAHHMAGNVAEWCADWYSDRYYFLARNPFGEPDRNPTGPEQGLDRVVRGGSWAQGLGKTRAGAITNTLRAAYRQSSKPGTRSQQIGFRLVKDLE